MVSRVAVVKTTESVSDAFRVALSLIGGVEDLNIDDRDVTVKVGIYDQRNLNYPTIQVVEAVAKIFTQPQRIWIVESDNHNGKAIERLQVWQTIFSDRVIPFSLSNDKVTKEVHVCDEKVKFSHILFKPNIFVSLHVLRKSTAGCIFKNLLGLIPDTRKQRFHNKLGPALIDIAEAVGIDLAIIDGTYLYGSEWKQGEPLSREKKNLLIVGKDPVAVEIIGSVIAGEDPMSIPSLIVAKERKLGETNIDRIEVLGEKI